MDVLFHSEYKTTTSHSASLPVGSALIERSLTLNHIRIKAKCEQAIFVQIVAWFA